MTLVVGVFDQQTMPVNLDLVMRELTKLDLHGDNVTVLGPTRSIGNPNAADNVVLPVVPLTAASANSGQSQEQNAGLALIATGVFDRLDLGDEERAYFRSQVDKEGASVIFVDTDEDRAHSIVNLFNRSNASRAEILG